MNAQRDRVPPCVELETEHAARRLYDAGILQAHRLRPRHWQLLRTLAKQQPEPFTVEAATGARRPARLRLDTDQIPAYLLQELARWGLVRKHAQRDPQAPRRVLRHAWLISPHMLHAVREAIDILAKENADTIFFAESLGAHARRLERTQRETNLLRQELLDLLAASPGDQAGKVIGLMDRLCVEADPHWYGTMLVPLSCTATDM